MRLGRAGSGPTRFLVLALVLAAGALLPMRAHAQLPEGDEFQMKTGVGWVVVLPDALLGVGTFHVFERWNWGIYADGKLTHGSRKNEPNFLADQTVAGLQSGVPEWRREQVDVVDEWLFLSAGVVRAITPHLGLVVGGGMARKTVIREYFDPSDESPTETGLFFVEDERLSGWEPNAAVSALIRGGQHIGWSIGFELAPRSFSIGAFLVLR